MLKRWNFAPSYFVLVSDMPLITSCLISSFQAGGSFKQHPTSRASSVNIMGELQDQQLLGT